MCVTTNAFINFLNYKIYYMEKRQGEFTPIFYKTASSILNIPHLFFKLVLYVYIQEIFNEFQSWIRLQLTYIKKGSKQE